jgi:hypothetical protein
MYHSLQSKNSAINRETGLFLYLFHQKMRKRPLKPEYEKTNRAEEFFKAKKTKPNSQNLYEAIKEIFPDLRPRELKSWLETMRKNAIEPELLLFFAVISGAYFRVTHIELKEVQQALWHWLTWGNPRYWLKQEYAELVISSLVPGIKLAIEEKGYKQGWPKGKYVRKKGKPKEAAHAAWVAGLIIDKYLMQTGMKSISAKDQVLKLVSILLGRKETSIGRNEFYRFAKNAPKEIIEKLTHLLIEEYSFLLKQDGETDPRDLEPPQIKPKGILNGNLDTNPASKGYGMRWYVWRSNR